MEEKNAEQGRDGRVWKALLRLAIKIGAVCAVAALLLHFVFGIFAVHTNDMYPAVRDGDLCITYRLSAYGYDQIIAYHHQGRTYFGRVVGLPGDVIDMDEEGNYTVNGNAPFETVYYETKSVQGSPVNYPYTVGEDELFVLCDLRDNGADSRSFGGIKTGDTDGGIVLLLRRRSW